MAVGVFVFFIVLIGMGQWNNWFVENTFHRDMWFSRHHLTGFAVAVFYNTTVLGFVLGFLTFKIMAIIHVTRAICVDLTTAGVFRVKPTNPDKAGGLGILGNYSLQLVIVMSLPLFPVIAFVLDLTVNPILVLAFIFYIPLLIFGFFYPLGGAHRAMSNAKQKTLRALSDQSNRIYDTFMADMGNNPTSRLTERLRMGRDINQMYARAQQMPVWPFNLTTLSRFGGILVTVGIAVGSKFVLDWLPGG